MPDVLLTNMPDYAEIKLQTNSAWDFDVSLFVNPNYTYSVTLTYISAPARARKISASRIQAGGKAICNIANPNQVGFQVGGFGTSPVDYVQPEGRAEAIANFIRSFIRTHDSRFALTNSLVH